jgi:DNA-binding SARP family transcriptional activator
MLSIRLFGRLSVRHCTQELDRLPTGKPLELFCYLLLHREQHHSREVLASVLWGDYTTSQSKKYLRQALWQIQTVIPKSQPLFLADMHSLKVATNETWLDIAAFEMASLQLRDVPGQKMTDANADAINGAVQLYRGDLLEGWYQDWCLFERERLRNLYLLMLDKLMVYSEDRKQTEAGLEFGERILRLDRAHERTYQAMMRLHYGAGDRAGAIRVFQRCATALQEELGIVPGRQTTQILDQIRADCAPDAPRDLVKDSPESASRTEPSALLQIMAQLKQALSLLSDAQTHIQADPPETKLTPRAKAPVSTKGKFTPLMKAPNRSS